MFREKIEKVIRENQDSHEASIQMCFLLEDMLDLYGNGWFDGDEELEARFRTGGKSDGRN